MNFISCFLFATMAASAAFNAANWQVNGASIMTSKMSADINADEYNDFSYEIPGERDVFEPRHGIGRYPSLLKIEADLDLALAVKHSTAGGVQKGAYSSTLIGGTSRLGQEQTKAALLSLFAATGGTQSWVNSTGWATPDSVPYCSWFGVRQCDPTGTIVLELYVHPLCFAL